MRAGRERRAPRAAARARGSRRRRPRRAPRRSRVRSSTVPRTEPITWTSDASRGDLRGRAARATGGSTRARARRRRRRGCGTSREREQAGDHRLHRELVGAAVAGDRELHLVRAVLRDRDAGARRGDEREPARLPDRHRGAGVVLEQHPLDRDRRRARARRRAPSSSSASAASRSGSGVAGSGADHAARDGAAAGRRSRATDAVAAAREPGVDAEHGPGRIEHGFDPRQGARPGRGCGSAAVNSGRPASVCAVAQEPPEDEQHDEADAERDQPLGDRRAGDLEQVDRLGRGASRSAGPPAAGRRTGAGRRGRRAAARVGGVAAARRPRARRVRGSRRTGPSASTTRRRARPRPNCATLPVIDRSVSTSTLGARRPRRSS